MTRGTPIQPGRWTGCVDGDDGPDAELGREPNSRGKAKSVVADADGQGRSQRYQGDRPTNADADRDTREDGDPTQVGHGDFLCLEGPRAVHDLPTPGDPMHTGANVAVTTRAAVATRNTSISTPPVGRGRPLHEEGLGAPMQLEPLDRLEARSSVQRDRSLVVSGDHDVSGSWLRRTISVRKPSTKSIPAPRPLADGWTAMASNSAPSPAPAVPWRRVSMTRAHDRRSRPPEAKAAAAPSRHTKARYSAATSVEPARNPTVAPAFSTTKRKEPGTRAIRL